MLFLDTHAILWLYEKDLARFTEKGRTLLEEEDLVYSPMILVELRYLYEIGRVTVSPELILRELSGKIGLEPDPVSFLPIAESAGSITWTRDPFDRIIAAHTVYREGMLLTRDRTILENCSHAIW